ncbi:MAG: hypothetical protein EPO13_11510 [Actinomycetota bacterium]|nr:MAG: hypothetical protein EPO13_11510 [Actinomycetota bacterium]
MDDDTVDFALAVWREDGSWVVSPLPARALSGLDEILRSLRQLPADDGALGLVAVADEFFLMIRVNGEHVRLLLSDLNAAYDWALADEVAERLGIDVPDDEEELAEIEPAGDLTLLADLGMEAAELGLLCSDPELYPDEQVSSIAARLGFAEPLAHALPSGGTRA